MPLQSFQLRAAFLAGVGLSLILLGAAAAPLLAQVEAGNLIANSGFAGARTWRELPPGWHCPAPAIPGVESSRVFLGRTPGRPEYFIFLAGGGDRGARVWCEVRGIRPHTDYLLELLAYRPKFTNQVYLEVDFGGQRRVLNQHATHGGVQPLTVRFNSGNSAGRVRLMFDNPHPEMLAFARPSLRPAPPEDRPSGDVEAGRLPAFFPIGVFAAKAEDLPDIRQAGFNAVQSYDSTPASLRRMAAECGRLGLKFLPNFRRYQADLSRELGGLPQLLGFYIEDEPELRSVPPASMAELNRSLKRDHPGALTTVAMLRPQMVAAYRHSADVFLLDPYPAPHMPLTWMSDCLAEAARHAPRERLWAIVQAFGGEKYVRDGWPRRPTYLEMRCLTFLAVVHGARGVFYFSYPEVRADAGAWQGLTKIVGHLNRLHAWLVLPPAASPLRLEMTSPFRADAAGRPAVHFAEKARGGERLLILVNVIDRPVSFFLHGFPAGVPWLEEPFLGGKAVVRDGNIREQLGPYEVRVYHYRRDG
ncbi:MAG: hypothetical protein FJ128_04905 [Deltaproteobacteria bacterium]|nr:hypothetical protein [Deltaproteobacteria bacterium]